MPGLIRLPKLMYKLPFEQFAKKRICTLAQCTLAGAWMLVGSSAALAQVASPAVASDEASGEEISGEETNNDQTREAIDLETMMERERAAQSDESPITQAASDDLESKDVETLTDEEEAILERKTIDEIVAPNIRRRNIDTAKLDSENWEIGAFFGVLNVEDFGSNNTYGLTLAYHVSDDIFVELQHSISQTSPTSFDDLSGGSDLLTESERELTHTHLSVGYQFHGEIFFNPKRVYNTNFYAIAGLGSTDFGGNDYFSGNFGAGLRFFVNDWVAVRSEFRNYLFSHSLVGTKKRIQNLEGRLALSIYF